jgi:hypothetical protein
VDEHPPSQAQDAGGDEDGAEDARLEETAEAWSPPVTGYDIEDVEGQRTISASTAPRTVERQRNARSSVSGRRLATRERRMVIYV